MRELPRTIPEPSSGDSEPVSENLRAARERPPAGGGGRPPGHALGAGPCARHGERAGPESVSSSFPAGPAPTCPPFASFSAAACCATTDWLPGTEALLVFLQKFPPLGGGGGAGNQGRKRSGREALVAL